MEHEADYLIVGAGSAGCVLANRLSADPRCSVLLLEAGGEDRSHWIHIPVGYFKTMHDPALDWCYRTEPDAGVAGRQIDWPRGKVLGGSSSLNGLLYVRGQRDDYDRWAELGNRGWGYADVLPYFKKSEDQERGANEYHGVGGPLKVSDLRLRRPIADRFIAAAQDIGIPFNPDYNGATQEGVGYFQQTAHRGFRWSTAKGFLKPARERANLRVETHAQTCRALFDGHRAIGVEYLQHGERRQARARVEVLLAAGAIGSPHILQHSGIGPAALLRGVGVPVRHDLPGVGGIRLARRIAAAPSLAPHIVSEFVPGTGYRTDAELLAAARQFSQSIYHPAGTCKMGRDAMAVVDDRLRVHGVAGLRVADASIMPELVSGNTNAPVIMIAEKAADMIVEDRLAVAAAQDEHAEAGV